MTEGKSRRLGSLRVVILWLTPLLLSCFLAGCSIPIGVTRVTSSTSYHQSTVNPLGEGVLSNSATTVLQRYDLRQTYAADPVKVIRFLSETAVKDERRDLLYALAELGYLHGERLRGSNSWENVALAKDYFLLSAVYAYFYLEVPQRPEHRRD